MNARKLTATILFTMLAGCGAEHTEFAAEPQNSVAHEALAPAGCPPDAGNERDVGKPCSKGGGECRGSGAPFCTVDVSSTAPYPFCTKMCWSNDQCGAGASCATNPSGPPLKGCVPNVCLP